MTLRIGAGPPTRRRCGSSASLKLDETAAAAVRDTVRAQIEPQEAALFDALGPLGPPPAGMGIPIYF